MVAIPAEQGRPEMRTGPEARFGGPTRIGPGAGDVQEQGGARVEVGEAWVVIERLVDGDADVRRVVGEAIDPVDAARQCLRIGARAVRAATAGVDAAVVERQFEELTRRFDEQVTGAVRQIAAVTAGLVDGDDGALVKALDGHRSELEALLGRTFDPQSRASVLALIEQVVTEAVAAYLDAEDANSPLARATGELRRTFHERIADVGRQVQEVLERMAASAAAAEVLDRSTQKGEPFEEVVHARVAAIAAAHGDLAERVGTVDGQDGTRVGDEVVTVNPDDGLTQEVRFVLEAKHRSKSLRDILAELERAMSNRGALAGIAVFARQEQAPTSVPFHCSGNRAIVVLDPDGADDGALRLAYMWARWVVRRELSGLDADRLDPQRIAARIDEASRALERVRTIRRCHTQARRGIEQAGRELDLLNGEVVAALEALRLELGGPGGT
jgi:hypothetical protein